MTVVIVVVVAKHQLAGLRMHMAFDTNAVLIGHLDFIRAVVDLDLGDLVALLIELFRYLRWREPLIRRHIEPVRSEIVVPGENRCLDADRGGEQDSGENEFGSHHLPPVRLLTAEWPPQPRRLAEPR